MYSPGQERCPGTIDDGQYRNERSEQHDHRRSQQPVPRLSSGMRSAHFSSPRSQSMPGALASTGSAVSSYRAYGPHLRPGRRVHDHLKPRTPAAKSGASYRSLKSRGRASESPVSTRNTAYLNRGPGPGSAGFRGEGPWSASWPAEIINHSCIGCPCRTRKRWLLLSLKRARSTVGRDHGQRSGLGGNAP